MGSAQEGSCTACPRRRSCRRGEGWEGRAHTRPRCSGVCAHPGAVPAPLRLENAFPESLGWPGCGEQLVPSAGPESVRGESSVPAPGSPRPSRPSRGATSCQGRGTAFQGSRAAAHPQNRGLRHRLALPPGGVPSARPLRPCHRRATSMPPQCHHGPGPALAPLPRDGICWMRGSSGNAEAPSPLSALSQSPERTLRAFLFSHRSSQVVFHTKIPFFSPPSSERRGSSKGQALPRALEPGRARRHLRIPGKKGTTEGKSGQPDTNPAPGGTGAAFQRVPVPG